MKRITKMIGAAILAAAILIMPVKAADLEPGCYSVTVVPTYQNPDTGEMEDLGQNPEVGQMMVEAQVQSQGVIEVHEDGTIYLTTRWNLAEPTIYAGFKTSSDGSQHFVTRNFEVTKQENIGNYDFAGENFDAVATDFRFALGSLNDTIRCSNYVEAMGRECVWYCYLTDLREGVEGGWNVTEPAREPVSESAVEEVVEETQEVSETEMLSQSEVIETETNEAYETNEDDGTKKSLKAGKTKKSQKPNQDIKERTVAEVKKKTSDEDIKTGEDLSDSTGIVGMDEKSKEKAPVKKKHVSPVYSVIGILILGAGILIHHKKTNKKEDDSHA